VVGDVLNRFYQQSAEFSQAAVWENLKGAEIFSVQIGADQHSPLRYVAVRQPAHGRFGGYRVFKTYREAHDTNRHPDQAPSTDVAFDVVEFVSHAGLPASDSHSIATKRWAVGASDGEPAALVWPVPWTQNGVGPRTRPSAQAIEWMIEFMQTFPDIVSDMRERTVVLLDDEDSSSTPGSDSFESVDQVVAIAPLSGDPLDTRYAHYKFPVVVLGLER